MGLLDPQGPSQGSRPALGANRSNGSRAVDLRSVARFLGVRVGFLIVFGAFSATAGCENPPPPAAAGSNEVFPSRGDQGLNQQQIIDDRWASIVLDESQRAEVREILEEASAGPVLPLVPARYGIRFEDTPHAMAIAAPKVEMAIFNSSHEPATASVTYLDSRGRQAVASIRLRKRGPIAQVEYRVPGDDAVRERANQLIDLEDRLGVAMEEAGATISGRSAEAIIRASVRSNHGRVLSSGMEPEQYRFVLLMLDGQKATLTVRREPGPRVLSVHGEAGLFANDQRAESLEGAFRKSLEAWGRSLKPETPDFGSKEAGPQTSSVGQE